MANAYQVGLKKNLELFKYFIKNPSTAFDCMRGYIIASGNLNLKTMEFTLTETRKTAEFFSLIEEALGEFEYFVEPNGDQLKYIFKNSELLEYYTPNKWLEDLKTHLYTHFEDKKIGKHAALNNLKFVSNNLINEIFRECLEIPHRRRECISGFIEEAGSLEYETEPHFLKIRGEEKTLKALSKYIDFPHQTTKDFIRIFDTSILDFLYQYSPHHLLPKLQKLSQTCSMPVCFFSKTLPNAVVPSKSRYSDVGYDISIIDINKVINDTTVRYTTGISLDIPEGYYVEIVPRSSLSNHGYILTNGVGIIDRGYRGTILITLTKISSQNTIITYPFKCCQLIFKRQEFVPMIELDKISSNTDRGVGGFGSTN